MGKWLYSKEYIKERKKQLKKQIEQINKKFRRAPKLVVILVGENKASLSYVKKKKKLANQLGIDSEIIQLDKTIKEKTLIQRIINLNQVSEIDGFIVQLPLPDHMNEEKIIEYISPHKDIDGFHPINLGKLFRGEEALYPCTPTGIINFLKYYDFKLEGKRAVIIGRSNIVGKPLSMLLLKENMTISIAHSRTVDLEKLSSEADFLFVATGKPLMISKDHVKKDAIVVDIGTNFLHDKEIVFENLSSFPKYIKKYEKRGYVFIGDVHPSVIDKASYVTPVPGGVGPLTVLSLIENTVKAYLNHISKNH